MNDSSHDEQDARMPQPMPHPNPALHHDSSPFINMNEPIQKHIHYLPHWQQPGKLYFITFHLGDSLPAEKLERWQNEKAAWMSSHPEPWDEAMEDECHALFSDRIEEYLDAGYGSCLLRQPRAAQIMADALLHFDGIRYRLSSFAIMPNHVHVLVRLFEGQDLGALLHSWKGFSANRINGALGRAGHLWQLDYWDRLIRGERHFFKVLSYIRNNPTKAHLHKGEYMLFEREIANE
jgi:REP element-mobilizing transposase RayT